ncbi:MAG: acyl-CoA thioesterase [Deltaproteobacteria bacterium]|nr:acyl-CoA thioesterase [Deltaproteobacteria bacterium]MBW2069006.1 acyl-CoA thioesterase [Deltaproteobacteria bacterium]
MSKKNVTINQFPVIITLPVLWGHMDAFQHVNNVIYFRYFESARVEYFTCTRLMEIMQKTSIGPILAATSCKYIRPLKFPDTILVGARTLWISKSEMEQEYAIHSTKQNRIVATGTGLIVAYNYQKQSRADFPEEFTEKLKEVDVNVNFRA